MEKKPRFVEIDYLRGLAMLAMIIIHTNAFFLGNSVTKFIWNYLQWAVPIFIFCSAFLFFQSDKTVFSWSYLKKRCIRLLKPYYIFAIIFFIAIFFREPARLTPLYIFDSLTVRGGIDISWLILLFLQFIFIMPFVGWAYQKNRLLFWIYLFISVLSSVLFVFFRIPFNYKWIMWLSWSTLVIYAMYFVKYHIHKWFYAVSFLSGFILFGLFYLIEVSIGHSLSFYDNKYPPTILIISYGIGAIALFHLFAKWGVFSIYPVRKLLHFLSMNSYELFFIHYLFLYVLWTYNNIFHFTAITFFTAVFCLSIITQLGINYIKRIKIKLKGYKPSSSST